MRNSAQPNGIIINLGGGYLEVAVTGSAVAVTTLSPVDERAFKKLVATLAKITRGVCETGGEVRLVSVRNGGGLLPQMVFSPAALPSALLALGTLSTWILGEEKALALLWLFSLLFSLLGGLVARGAAHVLLTELRTPPLRRRVLEGLKEALRRGERPPFGRARDVSINLGSIVSRVFSLFGLHPPRIGLVNANYVNAMALGSKMGVYGIVLTTRALLLRGRELEAVLAHEASHIARNDQLITTLLIAPPFLAPLLGLSTAVSPPIFLAWLLLVSFLQKIMEVRADLDAAAKGYARELASVIGTREDLVETPVRRLLGWLKPFSHPPPSFRYHILLTEGNPGWGSAIRLVLGDVAEALRLSVLSA